MKLNETGTDADLHATERPQAFSMHASDGEWQKLANDDLLYMPRSQNSDSEYHEQDAGPTQPESSSNGTVAEKYSSIQAHVCLHPQKQA